MKLFNTFSKKIQNFLGLDKIKQDIKDLKVLNGKKISKYNDSIKSDNLNDYEFKVFSQFGEDGIIQFLIKNIDLSCKKFIEFGVENYEEANTRFLLENNNWSGLIIDSSLENVEHIKNQNYYWKHDLKAINEFITRENINEIFKQNKFTGKIGILSIDVDGNDYWIWNAIDLVDPDIIVIEYNARLGNESSLTIPYKSNFNRENNSKKDTYGASLNALYKLGKEKGYELVGTNSNGNNAFFVKKDKIKNSNIKIQSPKECFHINSFSEKRDNLGRILKEVDKLEISDFTKV